jgi:hypothetical protein
MKEIIQRYFDNELTPDEKRSCSLLWNRTLN